LDRFYFHVTLRAEYPHLLPTQPALIFFLYRNDALCVTSTSLFTPVRFDAPLSFFSPVPGLLTPIVLPCGNSGVHHLGREQLFPFPRVSSFSSHDFRLLSLMANHSERLFPFHGLSLSCRDQRLIHSFLPLSFSADAPLLWSYLDPFSWVVNDLALEWGSHFFPLGRVSFPLSREFSSGPRMVRPFVHGSVLQVLATLNPVPTPLPRSYCDQAGSRGPVIYRP